MTSDACHLPGQETVGPSLSGGMSVINSAAIAIYTTSADKMNTSIDGDLQKSPRSPKLKVAPQRPGPNGSRVVRKRSSIPRLGAGLSTLFTQINSSLEPVEIPVTTYESITNTVDHPSDETPSTTNVSDRELASALKSSRQDTSRLIGMDNKLELEIKETEDSSVPYGSPVSSTEDTSFTSSNSFDGNNLSSPNSTPPPSRQRMRGKVDPSLTTTTADNYPFQPTSDYLPSQSTPHLADKLMNVVPFHQMNFSNNGGSPTTHLAGRAPHNQSDPTSPVQFSPFPDSMGAQVEQLTRTSQLNGDPTRPKEFDYQKVNGLRVAPQISPIQQPSRGYMTVPLTPYSPNAVFNARSVRESHASFVSPGTYSLPFPHGFTNLPFTQQPIPALMVSSKEHRRRSLELKLNKYILKDQTSAERSSTGVHVFVDMSNIGIGFMNAVKILKGVPLTQYLKTPISFENLARVLERGRNVQKRVLAGSLAFPASRRENWPTHLREAESLNYEMNIFDRVQVEKKTFKSKRKNRTPPHRSTLYSPNDITSADESTEDGATGKIITKNGEQGVDENLHLNMMHSILDNQVPGTMVLATGDAAQARFSDGFKQHATRALRAGWKVEVISWSRNMSSAWYDPGFLTEYADQIRIIELDEFIEELHASSIV